MSTVGVLSGPVGSSSACFTLIERNECATGVAAFSLFIGILINRHVLVITYLNLLTQFLAVVLLQIHLPTNVLKKYYEPYT